MHEAASDRCLLHPCLGPLWLCMGCQPQIGWWCPTIGHPVRGSTAGTVLHVGTEAAPSSAPVRLCDQAGRHTWNRLMPSAVLRGVLRHSKKGWVRIVLEECPRPLGCSGVWWLGDEGEWCPWLAAATLHRSWDYFGFWSCWNTKYRDFSLQPQLWGWQRVSWGQAAGAFLHSGSIPEDCQGDAQGWGKGHSHTWPEE